MTDYRLLIFDWDGTLVDSIGRIVESIRVAAAGCGLEPRSDAAIKGIIGLGLPEAIRTLYPDLRDARLLERAGRLYSEHYLALESEPSPLYSGVAEALEAFRAAGYRLAVATGKTRRGLDRVLAGRGWQAYFDVSRCADETASKPDPRMLHEILAHCGVSPEQALMVGDSSFDLQMARQAGVGAVAVTYGAQSVEALRLHGPRLVIDDFGELCAWLDVRSVQDIAVEG
ncbi:phosphoglycolate phosphatase [Azotobacter beijerinckii]|uniref:Phosphoglycolate phosphatase n=1 Tax=Azotobacter beijerinckii TaxID=170623 RepID=A0A1H9IWC0_9GAMM|nr:HAD-IA family hydrolase [Azotobacter beijerinckii]SEQ78798.1 phosphoglycolate phosphatase [Azotobacter beijerinckii]